MSGPDVNGEGIGADGAAMAGGKGAIDDTAGAGSTGALVATTICAAALLATAVAICGFISGLEVDAGDSCVAAGISDVRSGCATSAIRFEGRVGSSKAGQQAQRRSISLLRATSETSAKVSLRDCVSSISR